MQSGRYMLSPIFEDQYPGGNIFPRFDFSLDNQSGNSKPAHVTPPVSHSSDYGNFNLFRPLNMESDLEAILKDVAVAECTSRFRNISLSSDTSYEHSSPSQTNQCSTLQPKSQKKRRTLVGRGASYYQKYGLSSITIPKDVALIYMPNLDPMQSILGEPLKKTN